MSKSKSVAAGFSQSMFESIKSSLNETKSAAGGSFRDILKLEQNKTYVVRLIPNLQDPSRTFYHYFSHGWKSLATGQFQSVLCPSTWGERCPIDEYRFKVYRDGSEEDKENAKAVRRNENWMLKVYVISDPTNPDNEGKVKVLRYGKQLHKIIMDAIEGDDAAEFGPKVFDLSPDGCNFRIKVTSNSDGSKNAKQFSNYTSSKFLSPSEIPGLSTAEEIQAVYDDAIELDKMFETKTYDEIKQVLDTHFFCKSESHSHKDEDVEKEVKRPAFTKTPAVKKDEEDDLDLSPPKSDDSDPDEAMKALLAGL